MNTNDLVQIKDAASVTGYTVPSLYTYSALLSDFPKPALSVGATKLYRRTDLARWAKRRRKSMSKRGRKTAA
jgi:predicted DNA-binding transcriptional regulator AlpA